MSVNYVNNQLFNLLNTAVFNWRQAERKKKFVVLSYRKTYVYRRKKWTDIHVFDKLLNIHTADMNW